MVVTAPLLNRTVPAPPKAPVVKVRRVAEGDGAARGGRDVAGDAAEGVDLERAGARRGERAGARERVGIGDGADAARARERAVVGERAALGGDGEGSGRC